jgi:pimeloyl-ACP methyl ester carboxylesterase
MRFSLLNDLRVAGFRVRLRCSGTGEPVILLHDIGSSAASYVPISRRLVAAGREAVAVDLPGFGHSEPLVDRSLGSLVEHVQQIVEDVTPGPLDVIGRGFGAYLALSLAARHPDRYRRLILEDPMLPPIDEARAPDRSKMPLRTVARGALTTLAAGNYAQNVSSLPRARGLLRQVGRPDPNWWSALNRVTASCLIANRADASDQQARRLSEVTKLLPTAEISTSLNPETVVKSLQLLASRR